MVFRGKPSKACKRCRTRRLKCDLRSGACGQCIRATVPCSGYRDTQQLRIQNESQAVMKKVSRHAPCPVQTFLPLSIDWQARDAFFGYYITSRCWEFLEPYHHPMDTPEHLTLAIEAVSLAYVWHQVYSDVALGAARRKYVSALHLTNKALQHPEQATRDTTLMGSLLLDLFEKITDSESWNNASWASHVNGALGLVILRGLERFQDPSQLRILLRLSQHYIISCVASGSPVSDKLKIIQAHIGKHLNVQEPMLQLSDHMVRFANLSSMTKGGTLSNDECIRLALKLDESIQMAEFELPPLWQPSSVLLDQKSDRAFDLYYDTYSSPRICQARNVLRVMRIFLNEVLIEEYLTTPETDEYLPLIEVASDNIRTLVGDVCASVPQYVDCDGAARQRLPTSERSMPPPRSVLEPCHAHTPRHQLLCYTLILPLYAAGRSKVMSDVKSWVLEQLHYISSHFNIRNAKIVAQMLEQENNANPWEVYAMLGCYAFA